MLAIGVAYKAKIVCSGTFVSKREPGAVLADLHVDDLAILQHIGVSIDADTRSVAASAFGVVTRRAVYRDGFGCALVLDGLTPPRLVASTADVDGGDVPAQRVHELPGPTISDGMDRGKLDAVIDRAFSEPDPTRPRRTQAVVVVHRGRVVAERYMAGLHPDTPLIGWSMTKSVMNALVGILVKQGRLTLRGPVLIQEWQGRDDPRRSITLDNLLRMSSGLRFDEDMSNPRADVMRMLLDVGDTAGYATRKDLTDAPGTTWRYSSGTSNVISRVMRSALRDDTEYWNFPRRALFDRIGMASAILETDASGTFVGSSYMYATARDWARFGILYAQDGVWNGERVLPEGWVTYTMSPAPADPGRGYGAHFWLEVPDEYRGADGRLPADAFHAVGHEGQFVTIVPSREAVIVRLGRTRHPKVWDQSAFVREVLAALDHARR
jgi:CubicO group peptidase (beta-lactamase class C family)